LSGGHPKNPKNALLDGSQRLDEATRWGDLGRTAITEVWRVSSTFVAGGAGGGDGGRRSRPAVPDEGGYSGTGVPPRRTRRYPA